MERFGFVTFLSPVARRLVDVGSLQGAAVVEEYGLRLGELLDRRRSRLPVPVTGVLRAPEWQMDLGADGGCVEIDEAGVQLTDGSQRPGRVPGVDRGGKAVARPVGYCDGFIVPIDPDDCDRRPEDLLLAIRMSVEAWSNSVGE